MNLIQILKRLKSLEHLKGHFTHFQTFKQAQLLQKIQTGLILSSIEIILIKAYVYLIQIQ